MSRVTYFLIFLACLIGGSTFSQTSFISGEWIPVSSNNPQPPQVEVLSNSVQETVLRVTIPGFFRREVEVEGTTYEYYTLLKNPHLMEKGCPELPFMAVDLAIASQGEVSANISYQETIERDVSHYLPSKARGISPAVSIPPRFHIRFHLSINRTLCIRKTPLPLESPSFSGMSGGQLYASIRFNTIM